MAPGDITTGLAKQLAHRSKASEAISKADSSLVNLNNMILTVKTPLSALVVDLSALTDRFIRPGLELCEDILKLCNSLSKAMDLCKFLSIFPGMGLISQISKVIEKMNIEGKVKKVVGQVKEMFLKARDKTMKPIVKASNEIMRSLQRLSDSLQPCRQTLATVTNMFGLIDLSVQVLFDKDSKDKSLEGNITTLEQAAAKFNQQIDATWKALQPIKTFMTGNTLKEFKKAIAGPLSNELAPLQIRVREVQNGMGPVVDVMTNAMDKLRPVKWAIGKIDRVVQMFIGPAIEFIVNKTPLKTLVNGISNKIQAALGVNDLQERVSNALQAPLESLQAPLNGVLTDAEKARSLLDTFNKELESFRGIPVKLLFEIVSRGLKLKFPNLTTHSSRQGAGTINTTFTTQKVMAPSLDQHDVPHLDDFEDLQPGVVEDQLHMMDDFVKHEIEEEARLQQPPVTPRMPSNNSATPMVTGDTRFAPTFAYEFPEEGLVSVLMRVDHLRISNELAKVDLEALDPMPATLSSRVTGPDVAAFVAELSASGSGVVARQVKAGDIKTPKLDQFSAKCVGLSTAIADAKANIGRISDAAKKLDALVASVAPEAGQFGKHLVSMLARLKPLFELSTTMLALPNKYRPALTGNLMLILNEASMPAPVTNQILDMVANIEKANKVIKDAVQRLDKIETQSKEASVSYKAFFDQSIQIASPSLFPQNLGRSVTNLSGLVEALQARLDQVASSFDTLARVGNAVVRSPEKRADFTTTIANLDEQYGKLVPLVDATIAQTRKVAPLVISLYTAVADAHKVVRTTHDATKTAMEICRKAEAHVVSADVFRGLCERLCSAVAPFETVLAQLQAQATPTPPVPKERSAVPISTQTATVPSPVSQMKVPVLNSIPQSAAAVKKANDSLGGAPIDIVTSLIGPKIFDAMNKNLETFAKIKELEEELRKLTSLQQIMAKNTPDEFRDAIANLVKAVEPKYTSTLASAAATNTVKSLLDQAGSQSLIDIMKTIETILVKATSKPM